MRPSAACGGSTLVAGMLAAMACGVALSCNMWDWPDDWQPD